MALVFRRRSSVLYLLPRLVRKRGGAVCRRHFSAPEDQRLKLPENIEIEIFDLKDPRAMHSGGVHRTPPPS